MIIPSTVKSVKNVLLQWCPLGISTSRRIAARLSSRMILCLADPRASRPDDYQLKSVFFFMLFGVFFFSFLKLMNEKRTR